MAVKFMWNGIKVDGKLYRGHYSYNNHTKASGLPDGTITMYAKDYSGFPEIEGLTIINDSDSMTDYFEKDRVRITPDNVFYKAVVEAYNKQTAHQEKRFEKKYGKKRGE